MKKLIYILKLHKKKILIGILAIAILIILLNSKVIINKISTIFQKEELVEFEYKTYKVSGNIGTALITFRNENGISKIVYPREEENLFEIYPKGKKQFAIDYKMQDLSDYEFVLIDENGNEKRYTINYEIPRVEGNYTLVGNTYVNEPDLTGLVQEKTRYVYLDDEQNLVPGNWITGEQPQNWYNYSEQKWANIYVENNGIESYYVWIPRYVYKEDTENSVTGNERMDIKFINTYNEYIDATTRRKINI